jgi:hypothetical protein
MTLTLKTLVMIKISQKLMRKRALKIKMARMLGPLEATLQEVIRQVIMIFIWLVTGAVIGISQRDLKRRGL